MITENRNFERRHVLYCDILGFSSYLQSEFFETDKCLRLFHQLDRMIEEATNSIDEYASVPGTSQTPDYVINPEAIYCSDSIVISTPPTTVDAIWLCEAAARICNGICANGFLIRGAIVTGEIYHSGNTIFGPAIAKDTIDVFKCVRSEQDLQIVNARSRQLISHDDSKQPYIDPFWQLKTQANQLCLHPHTKLNIDSWRSLIENGLRNRDQNIAKKYEWIAKRFNAALCNKSSEIEPIARSGTPY